MPTKTQLKYASVGAGLILLFVIGYVLTQWAFSLAKKEVVEIWVSQQSHQLQQAETLLNDRLNNLANHIRQLHHKSEIDNAVESYNLKIDEIGKQLAPSGVNELMYVAVDNEILAQYPKQPEKEPLRLITQRKDYNLIGPQLLSATIIDKPIILGIHRHAQSKRLYFEIALSVLQHDQIEELEEQQPESVEEQKPVEDNKEEDGKEGSEEEEVPDTKYNHLPKLILAKIYLDSFVKFLADWNTNEGTVLGLLNQDGAMIYHPNPALSEINVLHFEEMSPTQRDFFDVALQAPTHWSIFKQSLFGRDVSLEEVGVSRRVKFGSGDIIFFLSTPLFPLVEHLTLAKRAFAIILLVLLVLVLLLVQFWQKINARELENKLKHGINSKLERMVDARTVELNFVTRTIKDLIDSIPSALVVLDRNMNILLVNLSFYTIFSTRLINVTGRNISQMFSENFRSRMQKSLRTKEPIIDMEMRRQVEGQGEKVLQINVLHLLGKRDRLLMVIDDITDRKGLERQLVQAEKMSGLGTLMSGIAHEINNPLNAISGMAQIIQVQTKDEEIRGEAEQILQYVSRVAEIVKELSRYSRSSKVTDAITTDIHKIIESALGMVVHSRKLQDVEVEKKFDHDLPGIKVNVVEIEQVLINLMTNAIDALEDATNHKDKDYQKRIVLRTSLHDKKMIQVVLEDNGTGIPADNLRLVFDPFFSTKEQGKGTGLGLSISYKIIQRYGGLILVESEQGQGTKFSIRLPISGI